MKSNCGMASTLGFSRTRCSNGGSQLRLTMQCDSMNSKTGALAIETAFIFALINPCLVGSAMTTTLSEMAFSAASLESALPSETNIISSMRFAGVKYTRAFKVASMCSHVSANHGMIIDTVWFEKSSVTSLHFCERVSGGKGKPLLSTSPSSPRKDSASVMHLSCLQRQSPLHHARPQLPHTSHDSLRANPQETFPSSTATSATTTAASNKARTAAWAQNRSAPSRIAGGDPRGMAISNTTPSSMCRKAGGVRDVRGLAAT
mmetsp:Transcript_67352/g.181123  ORF Transcript_67352/g.181123 Transcript_67352/m.181123 type:complete len:261 (+) Transcript_67352:962-1744(+)